MNVFGKFFKSLKSVFKKNEPIEVKPTLGYELILDGKSQIGQSANIEVPQENTTCDCGEDLLVCCKTAEFKLDVPKKKPRKPRAKKEDTDVTVPKTTKSRKTTKPKKDKE